MSDLPPFLLDLWSLGGASLGTIDACEGETIDLHEWTTHLRVRSDVVGFVAPALEDDDDYTGFVPPAFEDDGIAALIQLRDPQDLGGATIGLHHARLEVPELEALRAAVASIDWPSLPQPRGGDFNAQHYTLRYGCGKLLIQRSFNARSANFIEAIAPLWTLLGKVAARCMRGPSGTLTPIVERVVDPQDPRNCKVRVTLRNLGIGPIVITDPRVPTDSAIPRFEVEVGERVTDREWLGPFEWTPLALPALPDDAPRSRILLSRHRIQFELPWRAPKPGNYELRVRWHDYGGPIEPVPNQVPFMPVPSKGRAFVGSGPYAVRGTCQARLRFEIPDEPTRLPSAERPA